MKKGFTLLELIVVIIILGILATLGFGQYTKMVEKGRTAEARTILGQLRSANAAYWQEWGVYAAAIGNLPVTAGACDATHYFGYTHALDTSTAIRCTAAVPGKTPDAATAYTITLSTSAGTWSGTAGYY